ncbi:hypothetical protein P872_13700 [Rhodonellum psychrophilum GCM71 = DSM 17998]|uniref:Uncharacterized protein n=1 Tax=Rhodonellum psychrophilum GCM71 = DSM 17998 TaxID=1123057 RepID=U5BUV7_9BACT|nr:hypothetical protein P872_13700 [Rhodonellum psychrophilum GCM71 = DSM 17998]
MCRKGTEDGRRKTEDRSWKTEDRRPKLEEALFEISGRDFLDFDIFW